MAARSSGRELVIHPILFALYPPLALLASNILQIRPVDSYRSFALFAVIGGVIFLLSKWLWKDWIKAGVFASIFILSLTAYGQVYNSLETSPTFQATLGRHRYLLPVWIALTGLIAWLAYRNREKLKLANGFLNIVSIALVVMPGLSLLNYARLSYMYAHRNIESVDEISTTAGTSTTTHPDVYYIILDMYGRDDVLLERFDYDNSVFLTQLEDLGFYVARCSVTNYNMTELSIASSFNMNYLDQLGDQYVAGNTDRSGLPSLIHQSAVRKIFEQMGYKIVNFETGFTFTEMRDADYFLTPSPSQYAKNRKGIEVNPFESMLLKSTAFVLVTDAQAKWTTPVKDALDTRRAHIVRQTFVLNTLPKLSENQTEPKFVYAHILIPHPPFVFSKNGISLTFPGNDGATEKGPTAKDYRVGYRNQLDYINAKIIPILDQIIRNSKTPPIIILQGDHGVDPKRSFNLNAYYFPGQAKADLYPTISPVNTFRLVFDDYFGGTYPLLTDTNYASTDSKPFDFEIMKDHRVCIK
jgi:hypothetical protein